MSGEVQGRAARLFVVAAMTAMAAACASVEPAAGPAPTPVASAPMPVPSYDWFYHADGGDAQLVFGMEESDDVQMGLSCTAGSGKLDMWAVVDDASEIYLESGGETERFAAEAEPSDLHGTILSAQADADIPVFKRFRRVGWMASLHNGRRDMYVAHPENAPMIDVFFQTCG